MGLSVEYTGGSSSRQHDEGGAASDAAEGEQSAGKAGQSGWERARRQAKIDALLKAGPLSTAILIGANLGSRGVRKPTGRLRLDRVTAAAIFPMRQQVLRSLRSDGSAQEHQSVRKTLLLEDSLTSSYDDDVLSRPRRKRHCRSAGAPAFSQTALEMLVLTLVCLRASRTQHRKADLPDFLWCSLLQPQTETISIRWHVRGSDGAWTHVDAGFATYCCAGLHPVYYLTQTSCVSSSAHVL